ncbi:hypothetical protein [Nonomuraea sp. NPDC048826]|uniref:hypothetical protein n=1 Tax=Nonomuraea sp. NPDC048826 TaxID=3364347 RepID=UPI0037139E84
MMIVAGSVSTVLVASLSPAAGADPTPAPTATTTPSPAVRVKWGWDDDDHHHHHRICKPRTFYKIHRLSPRNFFIPHTRFIDGPGGSMTVSVTREHEVLAFLETENERQISITTGDVVRNLRRLGIPHLEERHMVFAGHEYTQEISKGRYGNMRYRVFGYRIGWSAWSVLGSCRHRFIDRGIANVPARVEGWRYWETKHPRFRGRILSRK